MIRFADNYSLLPALDKKIQKQSQKIAALTETGLGKEHPLFLANAQELKSLETRMSSQADSAVLVLKKRAALFKEIIGHDLNVTPDEKRKQEIRKDIAYEKARFNFEWARESLKNTQKRLDHFQENETKLTDYQVHFIR